MKAMIAGSLYDLCLSFVSIGVRKGKEVFLEENKYVWRSMEG